MNILILGINGMLGHKLYQVLAPDFKVTGTIRGQYRDISRYGIFREDQIVTEVDALNIERIDTVIKEIRPNIVINCIGIIKQVKLSQDKMLCIKINSLFPHELYQICYHNDIKLIHISTDCVFNGSRNNYREDEPPDAEDIYGKTKYLGEMEGKGALTIRTSIIGRELATSNGLLEWFIANRNGKVKGYSNAIFSGFPTIVLANILKNIISDNPNLCGLYHVSSDPISKYTVLSMINQEMRLNIEIEKFEDFHCNRSLDSSRFRNETGFKPLPWKEMIGVFTEDAQQYEQWRK